MKGFFRGKCNKNKNGFFLFLSAFFVLFVSFFVVAAGFHWLVSPSKPKEKNNGHELSFVQRYRVLEMRRRNSVREKKKGEGKLGRWEVAPPDPMTIKNIFNPFFFFFFFFFFLNLPPDKLHLGILYSFFF